MRFIVFAVLALGATSTLADSIKSPAHVYDEVYVTETERFYYVRVVATGAVVNIPKAELSVGDIQYSAEEERNSLLDQWKAKQKPARPVAAEGVEESSPVITAPRAGQIIRELDPAIIEKSVVEVGEGQKKLILKGNRIKDPMAEVAYEFQQAQRTKALETERAAQAAATLAGKQAKAAELAAAKAAQNARSYAAASAGGGASEVKSSLHIKQPTWLGGNNVTSFYGKGQVAVGYETRNGYYLPGWQAP
jgi:hypothetical protein